MVALEVELSNVDVVGLGRDLGSIVFSSTTSSMRGVYGTFKESSAISKEYVVSMGAKE